MEGRVVVITGASRGIGKAIAMRLASAGAHIAILAKTSVEHSTLEGTIYTAADDIKKEASLHGHNNVKVLPIKCDIRFEDQVADAISQTIKAFGKIDVVINNASAISLTPTLNTDMKRFDLMHQVNARGTYLVSKYAIPYLLKSDNPHIITLSPPLSMNPNWFGPHLAYTMSKFGMSMCTLGLANEFPQICVNALWPCTLILTAALSLVGEEYAAPSKCRRPEIVADAAFILLQCSNYSGNFCTDEGLLHSQGITDFSKYAMVTGSTNSISPDLFIPDNYIFQLPPNLKSTSKLKSHL